MQSHPNSLPTVGVGNSSTRNRVLETTQKLVKQTKQSCSKYEKFNHKSFTLINTRSNISE